MGRDGLWRYLERVHRYFIEASRPMNRGDQ